MTKKGNIAILHRSVMPTMTTIKAKKKQKLRNIEYCDLQSILDDLYARSNKGDIFVKLMDIILCEENIRLAYRNIKKNAGSKTSGTDGKTIKHLAKMCDEHLIATVRNKLQWYTPQAVRRVEIPKDNGKTRPLGIPTIMDRLIQQCILQILEPICEAKFHDRSNGFRPNRSCEHAIAQANRLMQIANLHYVIDIDIKGFFDNVNHGKLLKQMWTMGIRDKKLISIISAMLKAEVAGIGFPEKGTPQGGIISPLLSNIVLNELDWWIASQWEELPTRHFYKGTIQPNGYMSKTNKYSALRATTTLKECYIVRYADDFKIFCRTRQGAVKLFEATKDWLNQRLGLQISPEKSKIVNLKKQYSEFLGFKIKVHKKGLTKNGADKYVVKSHVQDKAKIEIRNQAKLYVKEIQHATGETVYKYISSYNSFVMGVQNYYRLATHVTQDFGEVAFILGHSLYNRLGDRISREGKYLSKVCAQRYGMSKQLRFVDGHALVPIGYVKTHNPWDKARCINNFTAEGRRYIHRNLMNVDVSVLHSLMRNPVANRSIEYNDNRISLYSAQMGLCAITGLPLVFGEIHCHHKSPLSKGGTDAYSNLILVTEEVHRYIHATTSETLVRLEESLRLNASQVRKVQALKALL